MNCFSVCARSCSKMTQVVLCVLLLVAITQAFIGKSHKSGWGGFDKRAGKIMGDLIDQSLRTFSLGEPSIPIAPMPVSQSKRNQFAHNFWGSIYLPPYPEKVKPPTTTAPPVVETQSRWLKKPISEYSVEYRTQTAYALLSLCCATPSCNDTRDKWNGICETLILPAESCQPLWEIRCEMPEPYFLTKWREENRKEEKPAGVGYD